jgi:pimeloyl-ACP methyl ester carboxylesterase
MKKFLISSLLFSLWTSAFGQFFDSTDFLHYSIKSKHLGTIKYHIYNKHLNQKLPIILFLQGSMDLPLIGIIAKDSRLYTFSREILKYADKYHIVLISKPGRNFSDTISVDSSGIKVKLRNIYNEFNTQAWRVNSADLVLKKLLKQNFISKDKVVIIGSSEGGQIVPELAYKNKKITHVVSVNGAGLNHFYDGIIAERMKANAGIITRQSAQNKIDSLFKLYEKIYDNANSLYDFHEEESYKRWASYTKIDPLEYLKKIDKPILVIASGNDDNSPILGLDYIKIEFLRLRKTNLTYKVYPNSDHSFNETDANGQTINKKNEVYEEIFQWLDM